MQFLHKKDFHIQRITLEDVHSSSDSDILAPPLPTLNCLFTPSKTKLIMLLATIHGMILYSSNDHRHIYTQAENKLFHYAVVCLGIVE